MKKIIKRFGCMFLAVLLVMGIAACNGPATKEPSTPGKLDEDDFNPEMSQLYVSNFNGGFGTDWLYAAIARFMEDYKDYSFEDGKTGVQVWVETHKNQADDMANQINEVFFLESINYYDRVSKGLLYDITEAVTTPLTEFGEDESIEEKMFSDYRDYFKTTNNKYYGLPHYQRYSAITYDIDVFDSKNLFFDEAGELTKKSTDTGRGKGPDNKPGTFDDGLPATYEQFYKLCETMQVRGVDPITWSGMYQMYTTWQAASMKADFEGPKETKLFYSFDSSKYGNATKLIDTVDADGNIKYKEPKEITVNNGYEMYNSAGIYYALDFLNTLVSEGYATSSSFNGSVSHVGAQSNFLMSKFTANRPIGMLVEGNYWINESASTFKQLESRYKNASLQDRRLALMPYPKATDDQLGDPLTLLDSSRSIACINANIDEKKVELATTFLRYLHTDESLAEYLKVSHTTKPFDFEVPGDVYNSMDPYTKSALTLIENGTTVLPLDTSEFFYKNFNTFAYDEVFKTNQYNSPITIVTAGMSTLDAFSEIRTRYNSTTWAALI